jgi:hypothetical protein
MKEGCQNRSISQFQRFWKFANLTALHEQAPRIVLLIIFPMPAICELRGTHLINRQRQGQVEVGKLVIGWPALQWAVVHLLDLLCCTIQLIFIRE